MDKKDVFWIKLMNLGHWVGCHQMESRSFSFHGYQFPLCARCTGVFVGEILGILLILFGLRLPIYIILLFIGVMGIDWFIQFIELLSSTNTRRLISGTLCGIGVTYLYFYCIRYVIKIIF